VRCFIPLKINFHVTFIAHTNVSISHALDTEKIGNVIEDLLGVIYYITSLYQQATTHEWPKLLIYPCAQHTCTFGTTPEFIGGPPVIHGHLLENAQNITSLYRHACM
jgi:hypothetical protein